MTQPHYRIASAIALLAMLGGCHPHHADTATVDAAIKANIRVLVTAFNKHDSARVASFDTPGYVGMKHGTANIIGQSADLSDLMRGASDPALGLNAGDVAVDVSASGDMAISRTIYRLTFTDPATKTPTLEYGNWVMEWQRQADGSWKAVWEAISNIPTPARV